MRATSTNRPSVRQRITDTAFKLFYEQGYRATGINQVIAESGVAKASFYDHFPAKVDLLHAYLRETAQRDLADFQAVVAPLQTGRQKLLALLRAVTGWLQDTQFRGCPFQNALAEAPPDDEQVHAIVRQYRDEAGALLTRLAEQLLREEPALAERFDAPALGRTCQMLMDGAIAMAAAYRQPWPIDRAVATLQLLLEPPSTSQDRPRPTPTL